MAQGNYNPGQSGQGNVDAWQRIIKDGAPQQQPSGNNSQFQNKAEVAMSRPLQSPVDENEDAGLAPWFGGITAILLIGFLIWRFTKRQKPMTKPSQPAQPKFNANDRKLLDLATNLVEIDKNT